jgi:uncharacterized membrane protein YGL010W
MEQDAGGSKESLVSMVAARWIDVIVIAMIIQFIFHYYAGRALSLSKPI